MVTARGIATNPFVLWLSFIAVHLWLGLLNLLAPGQPMGDVTNVYSYWVGLAAQGTWVGIDTPWVYPLLAFFPMLLAGVAGPEHFAATWLVFVMLLNVAAFAVLTGGGLRASRAPVAWWWMLFLLLLGPIVLGRIDTVTVALGILGMVLLATRPAVASTLLAVATWIKVWPAALLAAIVVASPRRWTAVAASAAVTAVVLVVALLMGSGHVFSFVTEQTGRGVQVESPLATPWLWIAAFGGPARVYYDFDILTFQIDGVGVEAAAAVMTPVMIVVMLGLLTLGILARRAGADTAELLAPLALAFTVALIVTNKVGSPQFIGWLAVPVVYGLVVLGGRFRIPAVLALVTAGLTQVIYPFFYDALLAAAPVMVALITVRNLLEVVLLVWAVLAIVEVWWDAQARSRVSSP